GFRRDHVWRHQCAAREDRAAKEARLSAAGVWQLSAGFGPDDAALPGRPEGTAWRRSARRCGAVAGPNQSVGSAQAQCRELFRRHEATVWDRAGLARQSAVVDPMSRRRGWI